MGTYLEQTLLPWEIPRIGSTPPSFHHRHQLDSCGLNAGGSNRGSELMDPCSDPTAVPPTARPAPGAEASQGDGIVEQEGMGRLATPLSSIPHQTQCRCVACFIRKAGLSPCLHGTGVTQDISGLLTYSMSSDHIFTPLVPSLHGHPVCGVGEMGRQFGNVSPKSSVLSGVSPLPRAP